MQPPIQVPQTTVSLVPVWHDERFRPLPDFDGGRQVISRDSGMDVTADLLAQLLLENTELRTTLQQRNALLATIVHDLKNPLAGIMGFAQILQRLATTVSLADNASTGTNSTALDVDSPRALRIAHGITDAAHRMLDQIDELLEVVRPPGAQPVRVSTSRVNRVDLVEMVNELVSEQQAAGLFHAHPVTISVRTALPELVGQWDRRSLRRVLANLIGNAVKYSPNGGIISVWITAEHTQDGTWTTVSVQDQGIGIPEQDLPHLFEPFRRASNVGELPGTGIGLASVRQLVDGLDGRIEVESREGAGSTFIIHLPVTNPGVD